MQPKFTSRAEYLNIFVVLIVVYKGFVDYKNVQVLIVVDIYRVI